MHVHGMHAAAGACTGSSGALNLYEPTPAAVSCSGPLTLLLLWLTAGHTGY